MTSLIRRRAIAGLAMVILLALFLVPLPTLLVSGEQDTVLVLPMLFDKTFSIEYTHSVLKTPVQEHFVLAPGNDLLLTSTTYKSLGVGTPFLPEEGKFENRNGQFVLTGLNRHFKEVNLGFMPLAKQALLFRGKRYNFENYFESGSLIKLHVKQYTMGKILWEKF